MNTSILQLLDERPLRLVASEEPETTQPKMISPKCRQAKAIAPGESNSLRPLLVSILLFVLTLWTLVQFWG